MEVLKLILMSVVLIMAIGMLVFIWKFREKLKETKLYAVSVVLMACSNFIGLYSMWFGLNEYAWHSFIAQIVDDILIFIFGYLILCKKWQ